jgi:hypothetical protein
MKQSINVDQFRDSFISMDRDYYSYEGYQALYNFLDEVSDGDYDLDVIGVCCQFSEDSVKYFLEQYNVDSVELLSDVCIVIEIEGSDNIIVGE